MTLRTKSVLVLLMLAAFGCGSTGSGETGAGTVVATDAGAPSPGSGGAETEAPPAGGGAADGGIDAGTPANQNVPGKWVHTIVVDGFTYAASTVGATNQVRFLVFEGLAHQYPNGTNYPIAAADFLWEVFRTQALPE